MDRVFYRLNEAKDISNLSEGDIIHLIESEKINAYAWCDIKTATFYRAKKTVGTFDYQGIIKIQPKQASLAFESGSTQIEHFEIIDLKNASNMSFKPLQGLKYPNNLFERHGRTNNDVEEPIKSCGKIIYTNMSSVKKIAEIQSRNNEDNEILGKFFDSMQAWSSSLEKARIEQITIELSALRFNKNELLGLLPLQRERKLKTTEKQPIKAPSPLDEIILDIIKSKGDLRSDQIWNILRVEAKKDTIERGYDQYNVVEEVSSTNLIWIDRKDKIRSLSRESFKNKVYKLKKTSS